MFTFTNCNLYSQKSNFELSGDILSIFIPASAFTSTLVLNNDNCDGSIQFAKSIGVAMITTYSLKYIINKKRPNGGSLSFPSGHTMSAFTGAAFLQKRYGWKVGIPAYITASYVGWTRINANKHDYWDVLGGAIIGTISAYIFTKPFIRKHANISFRKINDQLNLQVTVVLSHHKIL